MTASKALALLELRGADLRQDDVDEIRALLTQMSPDEHERVAGGIWEAVALVIHHPEYVGDAKLPPLEVEPEPTMPAGWTR